MGHSRMAAQSSVDEALRNVDPGFHGNILSHFETKLKIIQEVSDGCLT